MEVEDKTLTINVGVVHFYQSSFNCLLNSFMTETVIMLKPVDWFIISIDWFLYDNGLRHERVKFNKTVSSVVNVLLHYQRTLTVVTFSKRDTTYGNPSNIGSVSGTSSILMVIFVRDTRIGIPPS